MWEAHFAGGGAAAPGSAPTGWNWFSATHELLAQADVGVSADQRLGGLLESANTTTHTRFLPGASPRQRTHEWQARLRACLLGAESRDARAWHARVRNSLDK